MMHSLKKQQGLSLLSTVLLLLVIGFFLLLAFKVIPLYAENRYVISALHSLNDKTQPLEQKTDAEIKRALQNFYMINNVRSQGPNNIVIKRESKRVLVTIDYEARVRLFDQAPLVGTVDVAVDFKNHLDSSQPEKCCKSLSE